MNVLFITNNPNLGSTARILRSWLLLGRQDGLQGRVVTQRPGDLSAWLEAQAIPHRIDQMPLPDCAGRSQVSGMPGSWPAGPAGAGSRSSTAMNTTSTPSVCCSGEC